MARPSRFGVPTKVVTARVPAEVADAFVAEAERLGLDVSLLLCRLAQRAKLVDRDWSKETA
jgi:hypothetical protein